MKTDRELLELAAKAAGISYVPEMSEPHPVSGSWWGLWLKYDREPHELDRRTWNPLTDDGDALRLAVKLHVDIPEAIYSYTETNAEYDADPCGATRRAIVRAAAAEIGEVQS